jgi:hypothetical protein
MPVPAGGQTGVNDLTEENDNENNTLVLVIACAVFDGV